MIQVARSTSDGVTGTVGYVDSESLSSVWHELRSPLGCIKGYATSLLLAPELTVDEIVMRQSLAAILEASAEIEDLVNQLLDLSQISGHTFRVDPQSVPFLPLAESAAKRSSLRAHERPIILDIPPDLPLVYADPRRLAQVLDNLIDNASKYATTGPITVSAALTGNEVRVSVVDHGPGIPPEELDSIFDHFRRGRLALVRRVPGTGVGLAICRGIVEAHGGQIWAESSVNGHTTGDTSPGAAVRFTLGAVIEANGRSRRLQPVEAAASARSSWRTNGGPGQPDAARDWQDDFDKHD